MQGPSHSALTKDVNALKDRVKALEVSIALCVRRNERLLTKHCLAFPFHYTEESPQTGYESYVPRKGDKGF